MLIKEYRIPLPLSVEEYKIAQLYMIAKKSKEESQGTGNGVEIIKNEPYIDGPGGSGQYTYKIYHVGHHLPAWLKALLPKSALTVEEMAWNAYPYTKTRYTCPFIEKFSIEIETRYFDDCGNRPNVFCLSASDENRQIDLIDIVKEPLPQSEYKIEEDPKLYRSQKTQRGPLYDDWLEQYWNGGNPSQPVMCAYKLCRVEFKYWGMQNKIEKFIHDSALRKTMVRAHQQAWVWQDEWIDLTMADIRRLELETQEYLHRRMAADLIGTTDATSLTNITNRLSIDESTHTLTGASTASQVVDFNTIDKDKDNIIEPLQFEVPKSKTNSISQYSLAPSHLSKESLNDQSTRKSTHWSRSNSKATLPSPGECFNVISAWRMQSLARDSDSESDDDEFYDAEDIQEESHTLLYEKEYCIEPETDNIFSAKFLQQVQSDILHNKSGNCPEDASISESTSDSPTNSTSCPTSTLIIIVHCGSILDVGNETNTKSMDITTFCNTLDAVSRQHYSNLVGRIAVRHVAGPPICLESLMVLSSLSPYNVQSSPASTGDGLSQTFDSIPMGALPLFAISSYDYQENVINLIVQCNKVYAEFIKSNEGRGFNGKVCLIGDSVGAILTYDALCYGTSQNNLFGSELSIQDTPEISKTVQSNPIISVTDSLNSVDSEHIKMGTEQQGNMNALAKSRTLPSGSKMNSMPKQQVYCKSLSHPGDCPLMDTSNRLAISSAIRRCSSGSSDLSSVKLDFEVGDFFMFGSLLSVVLTYRKMLSLDDKSFTLLKPNCGNLYNLFHLRDPCALRIEPLLSARFTYIPPVNVPRYQKFPLGDGQPIHLLEYLQTYSYLFLNDNFTGPTTLNNKTPNRRTSEISVCSVNSPPIENLHLPSISSLMHRWWGNKRIDYALYCPEGLSNFPTQSLPHIFHSSYWESSDVISFILRQINKLDIYPASAATENHEIIFKPNQPREKWQRKRTSVKLKNVTANHRANDVIVKEGMEQVISGRFMYGPLDVVALTGEKVDIHMRCSRTAEWNYVATEVTDKTGRLSYNIPKEKWLPCGLYQFKMVVRGDHTFLDLFLSVVPSKTEAVVFSIDGSLTASMSVSGRDPKVRAGSLDVVRFWQELGYMIIYITGRPDMQQQPVVSWLSQHNFPHGLLFFVDGLSTDPLRHKTEYLKNLSQKVDIIFRAAYGSSKDISVYQSLDMKPDQIYIVGKVSKKQQPLAEILNDGYVAHLEELKLKKIARPAQGNARAVLPRGGFNGLRSSRFTPKTAKRTISYPMSVASCISPSGSNTVQTTSNNNNTTTTNTHTTLE